MKSITMLRWNEIVNFNVRTVLDLDLTNLSAGLAALPGHSVDAARGVKRGRGGRQLGLGGGQKCGG